MAKHAGFRRVVYNMALSLRTQMYSEAKCSDSKVIDAVCEGSNQLPKETPWLQMDGRVVLKSLPTRADRLEDCV